MTFCNIWPFLWSTSGHSSAICFDGAVDTNYWDLLRDTDAVGGTEETPPFDTQHHVKTLGIIMYSNEAVGAAQ